MKYLNSKTAASLSFALFALAGCAPKTEVQPSPFNVTATIQELMDGVVDPAADSLWDSVGSTITKAGIDDKQPHTDAEWQQVRRYAITLVEATNLLVMEGRQVAKVNTAPEVEGILSPSQIQQKLATDRAGFIAAANALHAASLQALDAIDAKDATRLIDAGGVIDSACEQCHLKYWYPNAPRPK